jgi:predicted DNA-binding transcriptional regulator YafY
MTLPRMLEILKHIPREPKFIDVKHLCELLDARGFTAPQRTVQRDLANLSTIFPISSRGRPGEALAWFWSKDAHGVTFPLPSMESLLSIFLVNKYLWKMVPPFMSKELDFIVPRIENLVKMPADKQLLAKWNRSVRFVPAHFQTESPVVNPSVQEAAFTAFSKEKQLSITYASVSNPAEEKTFPVSVYGIVYKPPVVYLVATAYQYKDVRTYALHRISQAEVLSEAATVDPAFSLDSYIEKGGLSIAEGALTKIVLRAHEGLVRYLQETPLSKDQVVTIEATAPNKQTATVSASVLLSKTFTNWLLSVSPFVEVLEPATLRAEVHGLLATAVGHYQS